MFWKSFDQLTAEDVQELVDNETYENAQLDYKGEHPAKWKEEKERGVQEKEKLAFLKDIISMANARGGDIVYGVYSDSDTGKPHIAKGIQEDNVDRLERQLTELIREHIKPGLAVQIRELEQEDGDPLLVVRVPSSWKKPHAVYMNHRWTYFRRIGKANRPCKLEDIRSMYTGWQGIEEKLGEFRKRRLSTLIDDEGPVKLTYREQDETNRYVLIHVIPVEKFAREEQLDVREQKGEPIFWLAPPNEMGAADRPRYTSLGRVMFNGKREEGVVGKPRAYAMWMRNGGIEAAYVEKGDLVHPEEVTNVIKRSVRRWKEGLEHHEIEGPFYVAVSLFGWKGNVVEDWKVNEDVIRVPHVVVDSLEEHQEGEREASLEGAYDYLWESLGIARPRE